MLVLLFFFFQAEDGIRDLTVTGVQTCALPISRVEARPHPGWRLFSWALARPAPPGTRAPRLDAARRRTGGRGARAPRRFPHFDLLVARLGRRRLLPQAARLRLPGHGRSAGELH